MARKTKVRKSAKAKSYKDNLTWTHRGWCKRIGKVSIKGYAKGWHDPNNFTPKKWYLGRDEDKARANSYPKCNTAFTGQFVSPGSQAGFRPPERRGTCRPFW